jgi:regulator of sigma E protease
MTWALTFAGFAALILLHEFGHFIAAKAVGMRVERFSLFFGRPLVKVRWGETEYAIGPIPLGGYVKITGMNPYELREPAAEPQPQPAASGADGGEAYAATTARGADGGEAYGAATVAEPSSASAPTASTSVGRTAAAAGRLAIGAPEALSPELLERAYFRQPVWKRVVVIGAGPAMNLLLVFVIWTAVYHWHGVSKAGPATNRIGAIEAGSPAAGVLASGDRIVALNGKPGTVTSFMSQIAADTCATPQTAGCRGAHPIAVTVLRARHRRSFSITPRYDTSITPPRPRLGVGFAPTVITHRLGLSSAASRGVSEMGDITSQTLTVFGKIFTSSKARSQVHSIVGISDQLNQTFKFGTAEALFALGFISLALAIVNLFPFLPLDGGHIFWAVAEKVRGRAIPFSLMERASVIGFALVLALVAIGLTNDIHTLTNGGFHVQ